MESGVTQMERKKKREKKKKRILHLSLFGKLVRKTLGLE
jgi:hypothetical protein